MKILEVIVTFLYLIRIFLTARKMNIVMARITPIVQDTKKYICNAKVSIKEVIQFNFFKVIL